jgi:hypothetical protein
MKLKYGLNQQEICEAIAQYVARHHSAVGDYTAKVGIGYTDKFGVSATVELTVQKKGETE